MTKQEIERRVGFWQAVLNCEHVRVQVEVEDGPDPEDRNAYATCWPHPHYDQMKVVFRPRQFETAPRDLDEVVVHELLHFLFRDFVAAARSQEDALGPVAEEQFDAWLEHEEEGLIDRLARLIVSIVKA